MKKLVLVIRTHKGGPIMSASLTNQSRGPNGRSAVHGNILGNSVDTNKLYKNIGKGRVLKYLRRKLLPPH